MASTMLSRRRFMVSAARVGAGLAAGACTRAGPKPSPDQAARHEVGPSSAQVRAAERARREVQAAVREYKLTAAPVEWDLAGTQVKTWAYNDAIPGPLVRVRAGDVLRALVKNRLPETTSVHWHGIALRNDMDGVPGTTQKAIGAGGDFVYEFTVPEPRTFFFHPHSGTQLDRGLYAPLIVDDRSEALAYDREFTIVLDDWIDDFFGQSPDDVLNILRGGGQHGGHGSSPSPATDNDVQDAAGQAHRMEMAGQGLRLGHGGDVAHPLYLINGRPPLDRPTLETRRGERLRLRFVNAGADTAFRVAVGGHEMVVTHSDGFAVQPMTVDALLLGMGERCDVLVEVEASGAFPLVALAEGKGGRAVAVLRSGRGTPPELTAEPRELSGKVLDVKELTASLDVALPEGEPDRIHKAVLGGGVDSYRWTINDRTHEDMLPLDVHQGERLRILFENRTEMFHPMHLHGHTFGVGTGGVGARKDTVIVRPSERLAVDLFADNPGQWMLHCHNVYHQEAGMMTVLSYIR
jgi:FtsP/CotA-like multicopper oxidase with cupredoxin domain